MAKKKYIVNRMFTLGANATRLDRGVELLFDGVYVELEGQPKVAAPGVKGAIQKGWLVEADSFDTDQEFDYAPEMAPMMMGPSQHSGNASLATRRKIPIHSSGDDSREVMNVSDHRAGVQERNATMRGAPQRRVSSVDRNTARRVSAVNGDYATAEDGEVVRSLKTPAKMTTKLDPNTVGSQISHFENGIKIDAVERAPGKQMPIVSGDNDERYALPGTSGTKAPKKATKRIEVEGISFEVENTDLVERGPSRKEAAVDPLPAKAISSAEASMRLKMAKGFCSDFPTNYAFDAPQKKKLARIEADFVETRPDVVRAIWMAETDTFKKVLEENFPEVFQGLKLFSFQVFVTSPPNRCTSEPPVSAGGKTASDTSGAVVYLMEELGDARLNAESLKRLVDKAQEIVHDSEHRDEIYEAAGDIITQIPGYLFKLLQSLRAAALAASKMDYEVLKSQLSPVKNDELEAVLEDVRVRSRSVGGEGVGVAVKPEESKALVASLRKLASSIETGEISKKHRVVQNIWELVQDKFVMNGGFYYPVVEFDETANTKKLASVSTATNHRHLLLSSLKELSESGSNPREGLLSLAAYLSTLGSEEAGAKLYEAAMLFPELCLLLFLLVHLPIRVRLFPTVRDLPSILLTSPKRMYDSLSTTGTPSTMFDIKILSGKKTSWFLTNGICPMFVLGLQTPGVGMCLPRQKLLTGIISQTLSLLVRWLTVTYKQP